MPSDLQTLGIFVGPNRRIQELSLLLLYFVGEQRRWKASARYLLEKSKEIYQKSNGNVFSVSSDPRRRNDKKTQNYTAFRLKMIRMKSHSSPQTPHKGVSSSGRSLEMKWLGLVIIRGTRAPVSTCPTHSPRVWNTRQLYHPEISPSRGPVSVAKTLIKSPRRRCSPSPVGWWVMGSSPAYGRNVYLSVA